MKKINVLALFDGMSCGMIALDKLGIKCNYYASEIDKFAIQVSKKNYPNIIHLGDIRNIYAKELPKIDLLIGGSPCQGFSFAGKQLNFQDERSKLFFEYVRLLKECKPKYFLLENVRMSKESNDVISSILGEIYPDLVDQNDMFRSGRLEPILINSALVSAQNRNRLYWTNIPNIKQPEDKGLVLKDVFETNIQEINYLSEKSIKWLNNRIKIKHPFTPKIHKLFDKMNCLKIGGGGVDDLVNSDGRVRRLTPIECERLQTVIDNYTEGVSNSQRCKMLGNGWTVDVIVHIFKNLNSYYN